VRSRSRSWKRTHIGEERRIRGQLDLLRGCGVDRVAFFHLGITRPRRVPGVQGIVTAVGDGLRADEDFPSVFRRRANDGRPALGGHYGYITKCLSGTVYEAEHDQGAMSAPSPMERAVPTLDGGYRVEQRTRPIKGPCRSRRWREVLRDRLAALDRPRTVRPCVIWSPDGDAVLVPSAHALSLPRMPR